MKQIELSAQKSIVFIPGFNCFIFFIWLYHLISANSENKRTIRTVIALLVITFIAVILSGFRSSLFPKNSIAADVLLLIYWYVYSIVIGLVLIRAQRIMGIK